MAQWVKNLPAVQETKEMWVRSLGWEDPLEKEMATGSNILAWEILWTKEPGKRNSWDCKSWIQLSDQTTATTRLIQLTFMTLLMP